MKKRLTMLMGGCFMIIGLSGLNAQSYITIAHAAQPTILAATASGDVTICNGSNTVLTGAESGGIASYTYLWSPGASLSSTTNDTTTATPAISTPYTFTVTDGRNCTASDIVNVTVIDCSGMETIKEITSMNIYPNPSEGNFNLAIQFKNKPSTMLLQIFNMNGALMYTKTYEKPGTELKENFNFQNLASGNYLMRITVGQHALTKTFIIK